MIPCLEMIMKILTGAHDAMFLVITFYWIMVYSVYNSTKNIQSEVENNISTLMVKGNILVSTPIYTVSGFHGG